MDCRDLPDDHHGRRADPEPGHLGRHLTQAAAQAALALGRAGDHHLTAVEQARIWILRRDPDAGSLSASPLQRAETVDRTKEDGGMVLKDYEQAMGTVWGSGGAKRRGRCAESASG